MSTLPPHRDVLPASELTPEAQAKRAERAKQLNRCPHGVNIVMRRCPDCESEGKGSRDFVEGATSIT